MTKHAVTVNLDDNRTIIVNDNTFAVYRHDSVQLWYIRLDMLAQFRIVQTTFEFNDQRTRDLAFDNIQCALTEITQTT